MHLTHIWHLQLRQPGQPLPFLTGPGKYTVKAICRETGAMDSDVTEASIELPAPSELDRRSSQSTSQRSAAGAGTRAPVPVEQNESVAASASGVRERAEAGSSTLFPVKESSQVPQIEGVSEVSEVKRGDTSTPTEGVEEEKDDERKPKRVKLGADTGTTGGQQTNDGDRQKGGTEKEAFSGLFLGGIGGDDSTSSEEEN
eukprot:GHVN01015068.1.p1 GENE.GHVN01015068.1~~GHVN01015068.1.p1  ORF type:complete len:200 (+),score=57.32 GHVN01015068.1:97-696(+)